MVHSSQFLRLKCVHPKHVRHLLPAPSSAQDVSEKRRRERRLELLKVLRYYFLHDLHCLGDGFQFLDS